MLNNRRDFIKKAALASASVAAIPLLPGCSDNKKKILCRIIAQMYIRTVN